MKTKHTVHYAFLLVILLHAVILLPLLQTPVQALAPNVTQTIIQAVMVAPEARVKPAQLQPVASPVITKPQQSKSVLKPRVFAPIAAPSERAISQNSAPEKYAAEKMAVSEQTTTEPQIAPVTPPRADASQLNNPAPIYPQTSRRLREQGVVLLSILVLADGSVSEVQLKQSSGFSRLDESALRAVKHWHFVAAKRGLDVIDFWYELPIDFSLNN